MKIIAIVNPKGGVGKTNTTRTIATGLDNLGKNILMGESDPQHSLLEWRTNNDNKDDLPTVIDLNCASQSLLSKSISSALNNPPFEDRESFDFLVIDGCALDFRFINSVLNVADLVVIPTQASPDDICQLGEIIELVETIQIKRKAKKLPPLLARTLINKARLGTALLKECQELLNNKDNAPFPTFKTVIRDYEAIRRAAGDGKTAFNCGNKNAKQDAKNLIIEIVELLK